MTVDQFMAAVTDGAGLFALVLTLGVGVMFVDLIIGSIRRALS